MTDRKLLILAGATLVWGFGPIGAVKGQVTFTNSAGITINDNTAANPFPSTITISGYTGSITRVDVSINGLSHTSISDVGALFTGPSNTRKVLLFDGPGDPNGGTAVSNVNLHFSDTAAATLPAGVGVTITSGNYKPGQNAFNDVFNSPAPAGPYETTFGGFNGANPNGIYSLFVQDFSANDVGTIASWDVTVYGIVPVPEPVSVLGAAAGFGILATRIRRVAQPRIRNE